MEQIKQRIGPTLYRQRVYFQLHRAANMFSVGTTLFHIENMPWLHNSFYRFLRFSGLIFLGKRNYLDVQVRRSVLASERLPEAFHGFRVLHLSDLHIDLDRDLALTDRLIAKLRGLEYDLCVLTGDYRASTIGEFETSVREMEKIRRHLKGPVLAVLGNHDFIEMAPALERMGYRFLLNENVPIEREGSTVYVAGVDDPHIYRTDNFEKACDGIPHDGFSLLLSHSPETYKVAAACGFDMMLCGHTHGGQVCFPGGVAIIHNSKSPHRMTAGIWSYHDMIGYTSRGTGACGIPVRFFCPPEIVLHELRREPSPLVRSRRRVHGR
ncbi:MAG TPA: metallophosphoesterase [Candidatus Hydrogenedentes bacterium]|nr:metallophosphoesterase [Candidatus Hydrogenedentota bacterium]